MIQEWLSKNNIKHLPLNEGVKNAQISCPMCSDTRFRLGINLSSGKMRCFNCGFKIAADTPDKNIKALEKAVEKLKSGKLLPTKTIEERKSEKKSTIDETIGLKCYRQGQIEGKLSQKYLRVKRGLSQETIDYFKLGSRTKFKGKGNKEYVSIPYWEDGKCVNLKYRCISKQVSKEFKWRREAGGKSSLYNCDVLNDHQYNDIFIFEAEIDMLTAWSNGIRNCVSLTVGANAFKQEWYDRLERFDKIYICLDTDEAGQDGAHELAKRLGLHRCYNIVLPDGTKDVNEFFWDSEKREQKNTIDNFMECVKKSKRYEIESMSHTRDMFTDTIREMESPTKKFGIKSKHKNINKLIGGGFGPGHLVVVAGRSKIGKSCAASSKVVDSSTGEVITLQQLVEQQRSTYSWKKEGGIVGDTPKHWMYSGVKDNYNVVLADGSSIQMAKTHPLLSPDGEPVKIENGTLIEGGFIAVAAKYEFHANPTAIKDSAIVISALLTADGGTTTNSVKYSKQDAVLISMLGQAVSEYNYDLTKVNSVGCDYRITRRNLDQSFHRLLPIFGLKQELSKNKSVPEMVYKLPRHQLAKWLGLFISSDGSVPNRLGVEVTLASKELIYGLKHLLLRLGIYSQIKYKRTKCGEKYFDAWRLTVGGRHLDRFLEEIPLFGNKFANWKKEDCYSNKENDTIPCSLKMKQRIFTIAEEGKKQGIHPYDVGYALGLKDYYYDRRDKTRSGKLYIRKNALIKAGSFGLRNLFARNKNYLQLNKFKAFCTVYDCVDEFEWMWTDVVWTTVETIQLDGQLPMYDLTMSDNNPWFIANDIVVHNTTWAIDEMLDLAYKDEICLMYSCEMDRATLARNFVRMTHPAYEDMDSITPAMMRETLSQIPHERMKFFYPKIGEFNLETVEKNITDAVQRYGCKFVIFDNLLFLAREVKEYPDMRDKVGKITQRFKLLAMSLGIVIVLITHPRKVSHQGPLSPDDLKESSSIFQDLDHLILLHRDKLTEAELAPSITPDDVDSLKVLDMGTKIVEYEDGIYSSLVRVDVISRHGGGGNCYMYFNTQIGRMYSDNKDYVLSMQNLINKRNKKDKEVKRSKK